MSLADRLTRIAESDRRMFRCVYRFRHRKDGLSQLPFPYLLLGYNVCLVSNITIFLRLFITIVVKREKSFWIRYKLMEKTFYYKFIIILL